jgi:chemotaxis response regulator CheB
MPTRVLIVDASFTIRALLAILFDADERFVSSGIVANAEEATAAIGKRLPDIAILEHPSPDALPLLDTLAAERVPVILLTNGEHHAPLAKELRALGAVARFEKNRLRGDARHLPDLADHAARKDRERKLRHQPPAPSRPAKGAAPRLPI